MGWFSEQLKKRKKNDADTLNETFLGIAGAIVGKVMERALNSENIINASLNYIFKYFRMSFDSVAIPKQLKTVTEQIDYICQPRGVMHRDVRLDKGWYKIAVGPMLGTLKEDGRVVALIPNAVTGYSCYDVKTGEKFKINKKNYSLINDRATYFYQPLPIEKLSVNGLYRFMLHQLKYFDYIIFFALLALTTLLGLMPPLFTKWLFSFVVASKDTMVLLSITVFMISFSLCQILVSCAQNFVSNRLSVRIGINLDAAVMQRVLSFPTSFFKKYASGDLSSRIDSLRAFSDDMINSVTVTSIVSIFSLVYVAQMASFAPPLVWVSVLIILINVIYSLLVIFTSLKLTSKKLNLAAKESGMTYAMISGIQKIKLSGAEDRMFARWGRLYIEQTKLNYRPPFFIKFSGLFALLISSSSLILLYFVALQNNVETADYLAFTSAYASVSSGIMAFVSIAGAIGNLRPVYRMAKPILDTVPEIDDNKPKIACLRGKIELNNITFRYQDDMPNVIDNLSLKIRPGEYVAIVGKTGCGKSTLVRLLLGFEMPQKGAIYYDDTDIKSINLQSLRQNIGTVMQNARLLNADILSNITITAPWASEDDAWEAAKTASIAADIKKMPMGMKTVISEGQGGISGGQRQRIAIARAIINKPRVLIFDEATSALDNITQKEVSNAIDALKCTRIVVAHRLTTIKNCSRVIVLEGGHIVEDGTYDELIKRNGVFADLVKQQRLDIDD